MDDLTGLSFNTNSNSSRSSNLPIYPQNLAPNSGNLRPASATPLAFSSRTNSPANQPKLGATTSKPVADNFANLVSFGKSKDASANLSLLERQKQLEAEKAKAEEEKREKLNSQFGDAKFWDAFEKPQAATPSPGATATPNNGDEEDLFAAFNANAPVDRTSHFPPPSTAGNSRFGTPRFGTPAPVGLKIGNGTLSGNGFSNPDLLPDDDDPFDLGKLASHNAPLARVTVQDDQEDVLGLSGKPASELPKQISQTSAAPQPSQGRSLSSASATPPVLDPRDGAIAEIMDMGFSAEQAKQALTQTDTGLDIQQAVGWLLEEAHRKAKAGKSSNSTPSLGRGPSRRLADEGGYGRRHSRDEPRDHSRERADRDQGQLAWMRGSSNDRGEEKDFTKIASEVGTNLFKSANSLWSQGRKKVSKAMEEFQNEKTGDNGVPRWMRDAQEHAHQRPIAEHKVPTPDTYQRGTRREAGVALGIEESTNRDTQGPELTDEALMLEMGSGPQKPSSRKMEHRTETKNPFVNRAPPPQAEIALQRQRQIELEAAIRRKEQEMRERSRERNTQPTRRDKLTREAVESEVAYVSPARRKKQLTPTPKQDTAPPVQKPEDLLKDFTSISSSPQGISRNPFLLSEKSAPHSLPQAPQPRLQMPTSTPLPTKKAAPSRPPIPISPAALSTSTRSRTAGTEAYKVGDYSKALTHYTTALTPLPANHPLRILLLANRAICHIKLGDPKACIADAEEALGIIGERRGEGEVIPLGTGEGEKNMKEMWGKVMGRKAEGLEQVERWGEAHRCWCCLVESGLGGPNAIQGKRRCEGAMNPTVAKTSLTSAPALSGKPASRISQNDSRVSRPASQQLQSQQSQAHSKQAKEALSRLRATNLQAEQVEAERLALLDIVNEKIQTWKGGKEGNLRALLVSLDTVLWPEAGWKKMGMHELVVASRVKVAYLRGISKVHPDKIPTNATTEQRMVCAAAFTLLNEAWDRFKVENKL